MAAKVAAAEVVEGSLKSSNSVPAPLLHGERGRAWDPRLMADLAMFAILPVAEMFFLDSLPNASQHCTLTARKDNRLLGGTRRNTARRPKDSSIDRRFSFYSPDLRLYLDYCASLVYTRKDTKTPE